VSVTLQPFSSNDATEAKFRELVAALEPLGAARDAFYADAYTAYPLGSVLYALKRSPLTRILTEETFRKSFASIYEFFTRPGTFEFYLSLLRTIFGEGAIITFTVPAPGKLEIDIDVLSAELETFLARRIVDNEYVYDTVVDEAADQVLFQGVVGVATQAELDKLMAELRVDGIYTTATLTLS
jgi:hypothetical protein